MSMGAAVSGNPSGVGPGGEEEGLASTPQEGGNGPLNLAAAREGWVAQRIKSLESNNKQLQKLDLNCSALIASVILKFLRL